MLEQQTLDQLLDEAKEKLFKEKVDDLGFPDPDLAYELFNDLYLKYFHNNEKLIIIKNPINKLYVGYGQCNDCKNIGLLMKTDACMCGDECTEKFICFCDCEVHCSQGHLNFYNAHCDGWVEPFKCYECNEMINPPFEWWGLSPKEHIKKYG